MRAVTVYNWLKGASITKPQYVEWIAMATGVPYDWFFTPDPWMAAPASTGDIDPLDLIGEITDEATG